MKKVILSSVLAATALLATSCMDNGNSSSYVYAYATVDSSSATNFDLTLDNDKTLTVVENLSTAKYTNYEAGDRIIAGIDTVINSESAYDYDATLYEVIKVFMGSNYIITDESEKNDLENDSIAVSSYATLAYGYLNILTQFSTNNTSDVEFYLVENPYLDEVVNDINYLNLELRFRSGNTSTSSTSYTQYVSFDMETFRTQMEGMDGVALHFNSSAANSTVAIKIDSNNLYN